MKRVATNNLFFTASSSLIDFGGEIHHPSKQEGLYYHLLDLALIKGFSKAQLCDMGNKLIAMADHDLDMRQAEAAEYVSEVLINAPLPREYGQIGRYYQAMCVMRRGDYIASRAMFERLAGASIVPLKYRARALQALAANYHDSGDCRESLRFHLEAVHAASPRHGCDLFANTISQLMVAVIKSIEGDHRGALADFEALFPFVRMLAIDRPFYLYSYRNSLALELAEAGRIEEALSNCRIILSSPLAHLNPEWSETQQEILSKTTEPQRSDMVFPNFSLDAHFPADDKIARLELYRNLKSDNNAGLAAKSEPGRILKFKAPKGHMDKKKDKKNGTEEEYKQMLKNVLEKLCDGVSYETLARVYQCIEDEESSSENS